jgi:hypothetical protein
VEAEAEEPELAERPLGAVLQQQHRAAAEAVQRAAKEPDAVLEPQGTQWEQQGLPESARGWGF